MAASTVLACRAAAEQRQPPGMSLRCRYLHSLLLGISFACYGLAAYMVGPSRVDLAQRLASDYAHVSLGQTARGVGCCAGSLLSSLVWQRLPRQPPLAACLSLLAILMLAIPHSRFLPVYLACELAFGVAAALIDVGINCWTLELWGREANPVMQALYLCNSIGITAAPLLVRPFLSPDGVDARRMGEEGGRETRIAVAYAIAALLLTTAAGMQAAMYCVCRYDASAAAAAASHPPLEEDKSSKKSEGSSQVRVILVTTTACLLLSTFCGCEITMINFFPQFAVSIGLGIRKGSAALMTSLLTATFAASRLATIAVAVKVSPTGMLAASFAILATGGALLRAFAPSSEAVLWISAALIGVGCSSVNPSLLSLLQRDAGVRVETRVCAALMLSSYVVSLVVPLFLAPAIDARPILFVDVSLALVAASVAALALLLLLIRCSFRCRT